MWLERVAGGGEDLVELDAARRHVRELGSAFDADLEQAIAAASAHLDVDADGFGGLGFPLVAQDWQIKRATFFEGLRLPFANVTSVGSVSYIDPDGASVTVSAGMYHVAKRGRLTVIEPVAGYTWPTVAERPDAVTISFTAGWPTAAAVPQDIRQAALLLVGHFFSNREATAGRDVPREIAQGVAALTARHRRFAW